jgi:hypothetical protein
LSPVSQGIVQNPTLWQKLTRAFSVKGQHVTPELGSTIHPVVIAEDLTRASRYEIIERPCADGVVCAASVGNVSPIGLVNLAGSGVLALVTFVSFSHPAAGQYVNVDFRAQALSFSNAKFLDKRLTGIPVCGLSAIPAAAATIPMQRYLTTAGVEFTLPDLQALGPIVLPPGFILMFEPTTVNQQFVLNARWLEIPVSA